MDDANRENRPLTADEEHLVRWMLEHGTPAAKALLPQLASARVTPWKCACGCASFDLVIEGMPEPTPGFHPVADFLFKEGEELCGIFAWEQHGVLGGVELHSFSNHIPKTLPKPEALS